MRKLWCLVKVDFRAMLVALSFGRGKTGKAGGIGALVLLAALPLYLSGMYSFLLAEWMRANGALGFLMPVMTLLGIFMSLMLTMFGASGIVYGGRDMDLMLSLPVPAFSVMLAKLLALYLENLVFCGLWLIPTGVALGIYGGASAGFVVCMALAVLFTPFLPTLLGALIGWLVAFAEGRLRRKALVASLLYVALFGVLIAGGMQVNKLAALMLQNAAALQHVLNTWLFPMGLLQSALAGSVPALLGYLAVCLLPFLAAAWVLGLRYKAILTGLNSRAMGKAYRLSRLGASGQFMALYKKEFARFFGTPIYLFNTGIGFMMLIGAGVYAVFARRSILAFAAQVGGIQPLLPIGLLAVAFVLGISNITCVSISLEGKQHEPYGGVAFHPGGPGLHCLCRAAAAGAGGCGAGAVPCVFAACGRWRAVHQPAAAQAGRRERHAGGKAVCLCLLRHFRRHGAGGPWRAGLGAVWQRAWLCRVLHSFCPAGACAERRFVVCC